MAGGFLGALGSDSYLGFPPPSGVGLLVLPVLCAACMQVWRMFRIQGELSHARSWYGGAAVGLGADFGWIVAGRFISELPPA